MNDITQWLQMLTALLAAAAAAQSFLNGRRSKKIERAQTEIRENVATIEKATNSMKDALVAATDVAARAQGTAAGLEQGRNERNDARPC
jgi:hypothetical protein